MDLENQFKTNLTSLLDELVSNTKSKGISWKCSDQKEALQPRLLFATIGNHTIAVGKKISKFFFMTKVSYQMVYYTGRNFSLENDKRVKPLPVSPETAKSIFDVAYSAYKEEYFQNTTQDLIELRKELNEP